jgi:hypothetical protein
VSDLTCPHCNEPFPSEAILLRHRQEDHAAEEAEAAGSSDRAAKEAVRQEEGRLTPDGFLRRAGARREPTDYLGSLFPSCDPGAALPPWERERLSGPD